MPKTRTTALILCLFCLQGSPAYGEMYFYKDQGIHLSNTPMSPLYKPFGKYRGTGKRYPSGNNVRSRGDIRRHIRKVADRFGVDSKLIEAVIQVESAFDPEAVSPAGAVGLMQLMPETAREMGVLNPKDPFQNITGGTRYLSQLLAGFKGDTRLALAAYNAGTGPVRSRGRIPPFAETRNYVRRVLDQKRRSGRHENRIYRTVLEDGTLFFSDRPYRR